MYTENSAFRARHNLERITVRFVIYGCPTTSLPTIVAIVGFVEWEAAKTFVIAMIVVCVLILYCLMITIARQESTCPTVQCVRRICLARVMRPTKCPVDMPFTGIASRS
jgi:hypothetical protein